MSVELEEPPIELPYDDEAAATMTASNLAARIHGPKVYLLEESAAALHARLGKRKVGADDDDEEVDEMDEDVSHRPNAILLTGTPISHLPTKRVFAYAAHYDVTPLALEWVNDTTCVLVFKTRAAARAAFDSLGRGSTDDDGLRDARPLPQALWPMEDRIASLLRDKDARDIEGVIRIRWALPGDIKQSGAREASAFYKKHGDTAGREIYRDGKLIVPEPRRERREPGLPNETERARLDAELDSFLNGDEVAAPPQPPRGQRDRGRRRSERSASPRRRRGGRGRQGEGGKRPLKSQEELDAELDAFLAAGSTA